MSEYAWQQFGTASVYDILGDHVVYRNLQPMDTVLPGLNELRDELGIAPDDTPRKTTPDYAKVIHRILISARPTGLQRLIYIGDTLFNDGNAFRNIADISGWDAAGFIAAEKMNQPAVLSWQPTPGKVQRLFTANRWGLIEQFRRVLENQSFPIDEGTAVVIDLDKTLLGPRGRNDRVIDAARLKAAYTTAEAIFNPFDPVRFGEIYDTLNQPTYHPITADNQDFLVYICLLVYAGFPPLDELLKVIAQSRVNSFETFEHFSMGSIDQFSPNLRALYEDFQAYRALGDPTPFKLFRRNEFRNTISAFRAASSAGMDDLLRETIVLTAEVKTFAEHCSSRGALLFAISDKPDEASLPTPEDSARGFPPLHRVGAVVVGTV